MQGKSELRLAHYERMKAFAILVGSVAHDFNNLLVGVVCNAEMLKKYHPQTDGGLKCVDGILNTSEIVQGITTQMLTFGGRQSAEREHRDLNAIIETSVEKLRPEFESSRIELSIADTPVWVEVDLEQVAQSLSQLVRNAVESVPEPKDSRVQIRVGLEKELSLEDDQQLFGGELIDGIPYAYFEITDNGSGFPESDLARQFEPFQSTKRGRARGIGLSIVYSNIVFQHGGFVRVATSADGTTVRVLIPSCEPAAGD